MVVQGIQPGGQLTITTDVENYPGFADVIQGPWLMEQMTKQAEHVGTTMVWDTIVDVDLSARPFTLTGDGGVTIDTGTDTGAVEDMNIAKPYGAPPADGLRLV